MFRLLPVLAALCCVATVSAQTVEDTVGPFAWCRKLWTPDAPAPEAVSRLGLIESARLLPGSDGISGRIDLRAWAGDNQAGTRNFAGVGLIGRPVDQWCVGLELWDIMRWTQAAGAAGWTSTRVTTQDLRFRFGYADAERSALPAFHAQGPMIGKDTLRVGAIVVELDMRWNAPSGSGSGFWNWVWRRGVPPSCGVWYVPPSTGIDLAQGDQANLLGDLSAALATFKPDNGRWLMNLTMGTGGAWTLTIDHDDDGVIDRTIASADPGNKPCPVAISHRSGLLIGHYAAMAVPVGAVSSSPGVLKYKEKPPEERPDPQPPSPLPPTWWWATREGAGKEGTDPLLRILFSKKTVTPVTVALTRLGGTAQYATEVPRQSGRPNPGSLDDVALIHTLAGKPPAILDLTTTFTIPANVSSYTFPTTLLKADVLSDSRDEIDETALITARLTTVESGKRILLKPRYPDIGRSDRSTLKWTIQDDDPTGEVVIISPPKITFVKPPNGQGKLTVYALTNWSDGAQTGTGLTYQWQAIRLPSGARAPGFADATKATTDVFFRDPGTYTIQVTVRNPNLVPIEGGPPGARLDVATATLEAVVAGAVVSRPALTITSDQSQAFAWHAPTFTCTALLQEVPANEISLWSFAWTAQRKQWWGEFWSFDDPIDLGTANTATLPITGHEQAGTWIVTCKATATGKPTLLAELPLFVLSSEAVVIGQGVNAFEPYAHSHLPVNREIFVSSGGRLTVGETFDGQPVHLENLVVAAGGRVVPATDRIALDIPGVLSIDGELSVSGSSPADPVIPGLVGGSHGGLGSATTGATSGPAIGDLFAPALAGPAGGEDRSKGGGRISIRADRLRLGGRIAADGDRLAMAPPYAGGGAGGSIAITARRLDDAGGSITALGGWGSRPAIDGGGGRILIDYQEGGFADTRIKVAGGSADGVTAAGAGTAILQQTGENSGNFLIYSSLLIVDNAGLPYAAGVGPTPIYGGDSLASATTFSYRLPVTDIVVRNEGRIAVVGSGAFDYDGDGLTNDRELNLGLDPADPDTNDDGILDGRSVDLGIDPRKLDQDGDGISNRDELIRGTDPFSDDTDRDGVKDNKDPAPRTTGGWTIPAKAGPPLVIIRSPPGATHN